MRDPEDLSAEDLLEREIPARLEEIDLLCSDLRHLFQKKGWRGAFGTELVFREALANAVVHGCQEDPECRVKVLLRCIGPYLEMDITDGGGGFNFRDHGYAGTSFEEEWKAGGRGRTIMEQYADGVEYYPPGNRIVIRKKIQEENGMSMMDVKKDGTKALVSLTQDLVASRAKEIKAELKELCEGGVLEMSLDMAGVEMVDSAGIGVLVATQNTLKKNGGGLSVKNLNPDLLDLFKTMRLDYHFEIKGD